MQDFYSKAIRVLVWLGEQSVEKDVNSGALVSDVFLDYLGNMGPELRKLNIIEANPAYSTMYTNLAQQINEMELQSLNRVVTGPTSSILHQGFLHITNLRWWQRVWVIQEVSLAKSALLCCGSQVARYEDFTVLCKSVMRDILGENILFYKKMTDVLPHHAAIFFGQQIDMNISRSNDILGIVTAATKLNATDPRDYIYGIRGLPAFKNPNLPVPDYKKPVLKVFTELFDNWQKESHTLEMLYQAPRRNMEPGWPSWVPDWRCPPFKQLYAPSRQYNAAGSFPLTDFKIDGRELRVKGKLID